MIRIRAIKSRGRISKLRAIGLLNIPLMEVAIELLIVNVHCFKEGFFVKFFARLLLDELNHFLDFVDGVLLYAFFVIAQRNVVNVRGKLETSVLEGVCHNRAVARHIAGNHAATDLREIVLDRNACLCARKRTYVCGYAVVFDGVDVRRHDLLIDHTRKEYGHRLHGHDFKVGETRHKLNGNEFVHANDFLLLLLPGRNLSSAANSLKIISEAFLTIVL